MEERESFNADEILKMATAIYNKSFKCFSRFREDLISEGVLGIVTAINKFQREKGVQLSTYAWNTGRGMMMEFLKKEKERNENFTVLADCEWISDDEQDVKEIIYSGDRMNKIYKIIDGFKEREKFIVYRMMEGYTRAEIARMLNTSSQSIWMSWERLKARIIREYNGEGKTKGVNGR